jgi:biopolymer transport protein ExbB
MLNTIKTPAAFVLALASFVAPVRAQEAAPATAPAATPAPAPAATPVAFDGVSQGLDERLQQSTAELAELQKRITAEKLPLAEQLRTLEDELIETRREGQKTTRLLETRTLDLANLRKEIETRRTEVGYLGNLFSEYAANFETRLHIAEKARFDTAVEAAKLAPESSNLSQIEILKAQSALLYTALERQSEALGGARFEGSAIDAQGLVRPGVFVTVGPAAWFRSSDGQFVGTAEQRVNSLEPAVVGFEDPLDVAATAALVVGTGNELPIDTSLGNAHKVAETSETWVEHIEKGGPVMWPIGALALAALLVALWKWFFLSITRKADRSDVRRLLDAVARRDHAGAQKIAAELKGPTGEMLRVGAEHLAEPRELVEEVMYEKMLNSRLKAQRFLPFVAISASSAPLLGLLGTVTGIMNTFTLMTVFGTGDVKTLSSGISEALITTEYGLIVAIPSLLLHGYLSRKARSISDDMERNALAFMNEIGKAETRKLEKVA